MCVWKASATDDAVTAAFPNYASSGRLVRTSQRGVFEGVRTGVCDIALTEVTSWEIFQQDATINGDCSLTWVGKPFVNIPASFGVKGDAGSLCTSLLRDVFNLYLHDMEIDGTIDELWDEHIQREATISCSANGEIADGRRRLVERQRRVHPPSQQIMTDEKQWLADDENRFLRATALRNAGPESVGAIGTDDAETTKLTLVNMVSLLYSFRTVFFWV